MNPGAIIISYNPSMQLRKLVDTLSDFIGRESLIVVDNNSKQSAIVNSLSDEKCSLLKLQENYGIARAINEGVSHLVSQGVDYFFTFDQDSEVDQDFVVQMIASLDRLSDKGLSTLGMLCPNFFDVNAKTFAKFTLIDGWSVNNFSVNQNSGLCKTTFAITSGSFVSMDVFLRSGGLDEDLFIDHVDSEYCCRIVSLGYSIWVDGSITFNHSVGERTQEKFLGLTIKPNNHNPIRRYYIFRNGIIVQNRYLKHLQGFIILNFMRNIHEIISIVVFEKDKTRKIEAVILGLWDGYFQKIGRRDSVRKYLNRGR